MHEPHRFRLQAALLAVALGALVTPGHAQPATNAAQAQQAEQAGFAADQAVHQAQQQLATAERELEVGRTPLPGERRGNVNGHSRLTPAYFARIDGLKQAVDAAKQQLSEANQARNALR